MDYISIILLGYLTNIGVYLIISIIVMMSFFNLDVVIVAELNMKIQNLESRLKYLKDNLPFYIKLKYITFIFPYSGLLILITTFYKSLSKNILVVILEKNEEMIENLEKDLVKFRNKR